MRGSLTVAGLAMEGGMNSLKKDVLAPHSRFTSLARGTDDGA